MTFTVAAPLLNFLFHMYCSTEGKMDSVLISLALVRLETYIQDTVYKSAMVTAGDAGGRGTFTFMSTKNCSIFMICWCCMS